MKEEVYILIDKNAGKSVNYVGIHKNRTRAEFHKYHREAKTKKDSISIKKAYLTFEE